MYDLQFRGLKDETGSIKDDGKSIYIYNVKQTEDLDKYPYNQWIVDKENNLMNWIFVILSNRHICLKMHPC